MIGNNLIFINRSFQQENIRQLIQYEIRMKAQVVKISIIKEKIGNKNY